MAKQARIADLQISVVIPTFNRAGALLEALAALAAQTLPADRFEVIVADDGSTDATEADLAAFKPQYRLELVRQQNRGAAAARNLGASRAAGRIILFLDADMIAVPGLLERHLASSRLHGPALVIGPRAPYPAAKCDPVVTLLEFGLDRIDPRWSKLPPTFQEVFTCNVSLPAESYRALRGFDEDFPASGYEDTEFAYRATKLDLPIVFDGDALAYHNHPLTLKQYLDHTRSYQASAVLLLRKHPELIGCIQHLADKLPIGWRRDPLRLVARKLVRAVLAFAPSVWLMERLLRLLQMANASPDVVLALANKLVGSYLYLGYRDGLRCYGLLPDE